MKSNLLKKIAASVLSVALIVSVAGCTPISTKAQWSYKYKDDSLPIGVYVYSLYQAYSKAQEYAQDNKKYDENESFLDLTIKDDDGKKAVASDWILDEADKITKNLLAVNKVYAELEKTNGATYDEATYKNYVKTAEDDWNLGYGYAYYAQMGYSTTPMKDLLEQYGVSQESYFLSTYKPQILQDAIFDAMYNKGGTEEVKDDELEKYFVDNYTYYSYQQINLYTTNTDESGNSTNTALSDKEKAKVIKDAKGYVKDLNNGKKWDKVIAAYDKKYDIDSDDSTTSCENLEDSSVADDIKKALPKMKNGEAKYIEVGEGENAICYIVYKYDINDGKDEYLFKDDDTRKGVLQAYKNEDLTDYLNGVAEKMDIEVNSYCKRYNPKMFWEEKEETSESEDSSEAAEE